MSGTNLNPAAELAGDFTAQPSVAAQRAWLEEHGIPNPYFAAHDGIAGARTRVEGSDLLNFASYNYLGFCGDPLVSAAAKDAIDRYGTSVSASRIVSGEIPLHAELESELASLHGCEDALAFVSGYLTNLSVITSLVGRRDLVLTDAHIHNSAKLGTRLSGAARRVFPHNDLGALDRMLAAQRGRHGRALVVIESVYSMDGDVADVPRVAEIARRHQAMLMVDEAHAVGVLGERGRGAAEHFGLAGDAVDLWMGTLSKTLASCGGYVAGRRDLIYELRHTTPGIVFSVGLPPPAAAAALAAVRRLDAEPQRVARLRNRADLFRKLARESSWNIGPGEESAIVPVIVGNSERALRMAAFLQESGVHVQPIVFPAVAPEAARLRFFFTSEHSERDVRDAVAAVEAALERF